MKEITRTLKKEILSILPKKMVLISGPRQSGKTTFSKSLNDFSEYLNFDNKKDRLKIIKENWDESKNLVIFDEIHKMKSWKLWLKGIYDTRQNQQILVTGSARLDTHRKVGDSMAGRYFQYRMLPLDLKELKFNGYGNLHENFNNLMNFSGFPEPFLESDFAFYNKWKRTHLDIIVRQDIITLDTIKRIDDFEFLIELMKSRVGSTLSYSSLAEDLKTDDKSVKRWLGILENAYVFFQISPYVRGIKQSLKKVPKFYFFDFPRALDRGAQLENFVAFSLLKEIYFRNDVNGESYNLHYLRDKKKNEINFLISKDNLPIVMIEVKSSDTKTSDAFNVFHSQLAKLNPKILKIQLVEKLEKNFINRSGVKIFRLPEWLEKMSF